MVGEGFHGQLFRRCAPGAGGEGEVRGELAPAVEVLGLQPHLVGRVWLQGEEDVAGCLDVGSLADCQRLQRCLTRHPPQVYIRQHDVVPPTSGVVNLAVFLAEKISSSLFVKIIY